MRPYTPWALEPHALRVSAIGRELLHKVKSPYFLYLPPWGPSLPLPLLTSPSTILFSYQS